MACDVLRYKQGNQYATIAENRIYDTALDDFDARIENEDSEIDKLAPRLCVSTSDAVGGFNNLNHIATYLDTKLHIDLVVFGGYVGFGAYTNVDRFLHTMLNVFEQQVFDALFKAQNDKAQNFRDMYVSKGGYQSSFFEDTDGDRKILRQRISLDLQLPEQYTNDVYEQDRIDIFDAYPEYVGMIPTGMRNELEKVLAVNDAVKLKIINSRIQTNNAPILTIQNEFNDD